MSTTDTTTLRGEPPDPTAAGCGLDLEAVAGEDRTGWSGGALSGRLLELLALQEAVQAELLRCVGEWDAALAWAGEGSLSAASWLVQHARLRRGEARDLVRAGRLVAGQEATAKALATGEISPGHVHVAARAAHHVEDVYGAQEHVVLDAARLTDPEGFATVMAHWRSLAEDHVGRAPAGARHERRHLSISPVLDAMTRIDGWVDAETGARLTATLDALEPPDPIDGPAPPRSLGQRRADALTRLVTGERPARPELVAVVDVDTLQGRLPGDLTRVRAELLDGTPLDHATLLRLACDAAVARVLTRGPSTILDLGRATPVVSPALRRALAVRDRGCVEPGCTAPPEWCDAHHKWHWAHGGPTALTNLELRCRRHHVQAHTRPERAPPAHAA